MIAIFNRYFEVVVRVQLIRDVEYNIYLENKAFGYFIDTSR